MFYPFSQQNDKGNGKFIKNFAFSGSGSELVPTGERNLNDTCIICVCAYICIYTHEYTHIYYDIFFACISVLCIYIVLQVAIKFPASFQFA